MYVGIQQGWDEIMEAWTGNAACKSTYTEGQTLPQLMGTRVRSRGVRATKLVQHP